MKKAVGFLLVWTVILFVLAAAVYGIAGNGELLAREMLRHAPPETTGLPESEYGGVGRMTADYLTGRERTFQYIFAGAEGKEYFCFRSYEEDHMADCRELIRLDGRIGQVTGCLALLLAGTAVLLRKYRMDFAKGMCCGLIAAGAVFGLLLVWGLFDFDGLFTVFHRIAFTNDGWLLDSRTDMLIRLMPVPFFISMGIRVLLAVLAAVLVLSGIALMIRKTGKKKEIKRGIMPGQPGFMPGE